MAKTTPPVKRIKKKIIPRRKAFFKLFSKHRILSGNDKGKAIMVTRLYNVKMSDLDMGRQFE